MKTNTPPSLNIFGWPPESVSSLFQIPLMIMGLAVLAVSQGPGSLDQNFGTGGEVFTAIKVPGYEYFYPQSRSMLVQPDGKILVCGAFWEDGISAWYGTFIVRYMPDGTVDQSFGTNGKVAAISEYPSGPTVGQDIALQPDGKIVLIGGMFTNGEGFIVQRYTSSGVLDTTFGNGGTARVPLYHSGWATRGESIVIRHDGKIVGAGWEMLFDWGTGSSVSAIVAFCMNSDGTMDNSFGQSGNGLISIEGGYDQPDLIAQPDGKILIPGQVRNPFRFILARYDANGLPDPTFGTRGQILDQASPYSSVVLQPNGKIVTGGTIGESQQARARFARYDSDGSLDTSFGTNGILLLEAGFLDHIFENSLLLLSDGKIIATGTIPNQTTRRLDFVVVRLTANGSLDQTFGTGGRSIFSVNAGATNYAAASVGAIQQDGKILVSGYFGYYRTDSHERIPLIRLNGDGALTVTNTNDSGPGSLRQTIADAVPGSTINFDVTGTITLTSGQLVIAKDLTIRGPGANLLSISGGLTYNNRVFLIDEDVTATLDGITIKDGCEGGVGGGIASLIGAHVTVSNSVVTGNCNGSYGAGIANWGGTLIVSDSVISGNQELFYDGGGGGIWNYAYAPDYHTYIGATLIVRNSTISNNLAFGSGGGGIYNEGGTMTIMNSTIANNIADDGAGYGWSGGIGSEGPTAVASISNCTISGNSSGGTGGFDGIATTFRNNIVSTNRGGDLTGTFTTASHNLIGDAGSSGGIQNGVNGNLVGFNERLGPLADNGGLTMTQALRAGSPAINAGDNCVLTTNGCGDGNLALPADQRGLPRNGNVDIGAFERQATDPSFVTLFDFDGDGKADHSVYRPGEGNWYVYGSQTGFVGAAQWGVATDRVVAADYDGDGRTDHAVYRDGTWWVLNSNGGASSIEWGISSDVPVPAYYDGDGKADLAVYRNGTWWILYANGTASATEWGISTDIPVPADYDGDGKADLAVYRNGTWWVIKSNGGYISTEWGISTDKPVPADYDGDGKTDLAVYRDGDWWILYANGSGASSTNWGISTDKPVPADYDGDGKTDLAVYRDGDWWVINSKGGASSTNWGLATDRPIPQRPAP